MRSLNDWRGVQGNCEDGADSVHDFGRFGMTSRHTPRHFPLLTRSGSIGRRSYILDIVVAVCL